MRISDWSSDVCSSDLTCGRDHHGGGYTADPGEEGPLLRGSSVSGTHPATAGAGKDSGGKAGRLEQDAAAAAAGDRGRRRKRWPGRRRGSDRFGTPPPARAEKARDRREEGAEERTRLR